MSQQCLCVILMSVRNKKGWGELGGGTYMRYEVVAVDIDGGQHKAGHEDHQPKGQAA